MGADRAVSEEALIAAASKGDQSAFGQIVINYQALVYNTIRTRVRNNEDAMDLSQDVFLKIWRSLPSWRGDCRFSTWIYRICINTSVDFLRKTAGAIVESLTVQDDDGDERTVEVADESISASPERLSERNETSAIVRQAIEALPDEQRDVVVLRDIDGYSYEEIADMLELEIGTVKSRLNRARTNLRSTLAEFKDIICK